MKRIKNWFKELELYQIFIGIFLSFAIFIFVMIPFEIYKDSITHYDITVTYINGESEVFHCSSYKQNDEYLYYYVSVDYCYINLENIVLWNIHSIECDCDKV